MRDNRFLYKLIDAMIGGKILPTEDFQKFNDNRYAQRQVVDEWLESSTISMRSLITILYQTNPRLATRIYNKILDEMSNGRPRDN